MSQSIYVTLESLATETSVPEVKDKKGNVTRKSYGSISHTLPRENYPTAEEYDNEEKFLTWAQESGALLSLLQNGVGSWLISDRATFKQPIKGEWSPEIGQKNVDKRKWSTSSRPENAKTDKQKAIDALGKLSAEEIAKIMANM